MKLTSPQNTRRAPPVATSNATASAETQSTVKLVKEVTCYICTETFSDKTYVKLPNGFAFCPSCLEYAFRLAARDEALYPPTCEGDAIPVELVQIHWSTSTRKAFHDKVIEYATPAPSRLYCQKATCHMFLGEKKTIKMKVVCTSCKTETCGLCGVWWHEELEFCSKDADASVVKHLKSNLGYQTCPGCQRVVERSTGCLHMTCCCGTHFCYTCGLNTCDTTHH